MKNIFFFYIFSKSVLHRCIPNTKDAPGAQVKDMYNILNSWGAAQQFLADIYKTWPLITLICLLSLGKISLY